jgi:peptidoglycan-associated lipoprotein
MTRNWTLAIVCALAAAAATGCGKTIVPKTPSAPSIANAGPASPAADRERDALAAAATPHAMSEDELFAQKTLDELNAEAPLKNVYFDLDNSVLDEKARLILQANAQWLTRWPSTRILINGHTDERGTGEYNLALGDRRAATVKEYLVSLGVAPHRLVPVTLGEETPVCGQHAESCWWQNRRGMFVINAK